jgi:hypothetical protein
VIVFGLAPAGPSTLFRVPAAGGTAVPVTALAKGEFGHRFPQFLPDGRHFLYLTVSPADPNRTGIYAGSIDAKPEEQSLKRLLATDREAYYAASPAGGRGRLVFLRGTTLMAQPFDPGKMELSGEPVPIAEGVDSYPRANYALFSVSDTGAVVYREGGGSRTQLTWFDENGNATGTIGEPGDYANPAFSPDGSRVAVALGTAANRVSGFWTSAGVLPLASLSIRLKTAVGVVAGRQEYRLHFGPRGTLGLIHQAHGWFGGRTSTAEIGQHQGPHRVV